jgi:hypothetical protein
MNRLLKRKDPKNIPTYLVPPSERTSQFSAADINYLFQGARYAFLPSAIDTTTSLVKDMRTIQANNPIRKTSVSNFASPCHRHACNKFNGKTEI